MPRHFTQAEATTMFEFIEHLSSKCCYCLRKRTPEDCVDCFASKARQVLENLKGTTEIPGHHFNGDEPLKY